MPDYMSDGKQVKMSAGGWVSDQARTKQLGIKGVVAQTPRARIPGNSKTRISQLSIATMATRVSS